MRIAVLDEDRSQRRLLLETLTTAGHACVAIEDHKTLPAALRRDNVDLLILHCQPSAGGGIESVQWAREHKPGMPVLLIVSPADGEAIDAGLAAGAADYLIKPLRRAELATRVAAQLRRAYPSHSPAEFTQFDQFLFESPACRLTVAGQAIELTQKEFNLALFFFRHMGRPLSRATIQEAVWAQEGKVASRTIDTHVSRVRSKLGLRPENGYRLAPVYSYGYQLEKTAD